MNYLIKSGQHKTISGVFRKLLITTSFSEYTYLKVLNESPYSLSLTIFINIGYV